MSITECIRNTPDELIPLHVHSMAFLQWFIVQTQIIIIRRKYIIALLLKIVRNEPRKKRQKNEIKWRSTSDAADCGYSFASSMHDSVTFIRDIRFRTTPRGQLLRRHYVTFMRFCRNVLVLVSIHNFYCPPLASLWRLSIFFYIHFALLLFILFVYNMAMEKHDAVFDNSRR